jgi:hypothetical protein
VNLREVPQTLDSFKQIILNYSFYDIIEGGFFDNRKGYPNPPRLSICPTCGSKYKDPVKKARFDRQRKEYNEEQARVEKLFKEALYHYFRISDHPKANDVFWLAWQKGHSSGLTEVYNECCDLVELIK